MNVIAPEWTEGRLDDLNGKVDCGFEKVDQHLGRIDARLDGMQRAMIQAVVAITTAILAGFGGIIALIATQL